MAHKFNIIKPILPADYGDWGVSDQQINEFLDSIPEGEDIVFNINSPGGDVFTAYSIYNAIKNKSATNSISVHVIGLAASAATIIASAADKGQLMIAETASYLIHNAWSISFGDYRAMEKASKTLKDINGQIINIYKKRSKLSKNELQNIMDEDRIITAQKALEYGVVDKIYTPGEEEENESNAQAYKGFDSYKALEDEFIKPIISKNPDAYIKNIQSGIAAYKPIEDKQEKQVFKNSKEEDFMSNEFERLYNEQKEAIANLNGELEKANNQVTSLTSELEAAKNSLQEEKNISSDLKNELKTEKGNFENFRNETFEREETARVEALIKEGKVAAAEKDEEIAILVERRVANIGNEEGESNSYTARVELLNSRSDMHKNLKEPLTENLDGSGEDYKAEGTDSVHARELAIDKRAEEISAEKGISYQEAEVIARAEIMGGNK